MRASMEFVRGSSAYFQGFRTKFRELSTYFLGCKWGEHLSWFILTLTISSFVHTVLAYILQGPIPRMM